jgi:hypothetical protein
VKGSPDVGRRVPGNMSAVKNDEQRNKEMIFIGLNN